jgi:uncharacterized protein
LLFGKGSLVKTPSTNPEAVGLLAAEVARLFPVPPRCHLFRTERRTYVYDTNTAYILGCDAVSADLAEALGQAIFPQAVRRLCERHSPELVAESLAKIVELGTSHNPPLLSVEKPKEILYERDFDCFRELFSRQMQSVTLCVANECNLRCRYCIYSGRYPERTANHDGTMAEETVRETLDYYLRHSSDSSRMHLGFYGGEPTLSMDLVRFAVQYLKAGASGKELAFGMTTNLVDVDEETLAFLCENKFALVVSLDGPEPVHDRYRVRADGSGTFRRVMRNLERIRDRDPEYFGLHVSMQAVLAPPFNAKEIVDFFSTSPLFERKGNFISFGEMESPEVIFADQGPDFFSVAEILQCYEEFLDLIRSGDMNERYRSPRREVLNTLFHREFLQMFRRPRRTTAKMEAVSPGGICVPGHRKLFVRTDGAFFPCERIPEIEPFRIGSSREGIDIPKAYRLCESFVGMTPDDCRECWGVLLCNGVCFRHAFDASGPRPDKKRQACQDMREAKSKSLTRMCSVLEANPRGFDYLNDYLVS